MDNFRLRRTWGGNFVLEIEETRHRMDDCNGSGYYDEWQSKRWRKATLEEAQRAGMKMA